MFGDGSLTFREFARREPLPLATIHDADLRRLLLAFPHLKTGEGPVAECLRAAGDSAEVLAAWQDLAAQEILPDDEDAGY